MKKILTIWLFLIFVPAWFFAMPAAIAEGKEKIAFLNLNEIGHLLILFAGNHDGVKF